MRKITPNTEHYFPGHIREIEEFQEISKAYDSLLNTAWNDMGTVFDNNHIDTMDADECSRREAMLGITPSPLDTIEDRRRRIKGYYASNLPYTEKKMHDVLSAMCGQDGYQLTIDKPAKTLVAGIRLNSVQMVENARELMRMMAPADVTVTARILYNIHARFRVLTHAELNAYTHYQLRNDVAFQWDVNINADISEFKHSELVSYTHQDLMMGEL